jgi:cytochrome b involved in lipid metabolism
VAGVDASSILSSRLTPVPVSDAFEYIEPATYQPDLNLKDWKGPERGTSSKLWECFANFVTLPVHDYCICKDGIEAKKAWREKVAIFIIFLFVSAVLVGAVSLVPMFFCNESEEFYAMNQVVENGWTTIFGKVYNLEEFMDVHPGGSVVLADFRGVDASRLFARLPPTELPAYCLSDHLNASVFNETNSLGLQNITCQPPTADEILLYGEEGNCHTTFAGRESMDEKLGQYQEGELVIAGWDRGPTGLPDGTQVILIDEVFYNVTKYLDQIR